MFEIIIITINIMIMIFMIADDDDHYHDIEDDYDDSVTCISLIP